MRNSCVKGREIKCYNAVTEWFFEITEHDITYTGNSRRNIILRKMTDFFFYCSSHYSLKVSLVNIMIILVEKCKKHDDEC